MDCSSGSLSGVKFERTKVEVDRRSQIVKYLSLLLSVRVITQGRLVPTSYKYDRQG